MRAPERTIHLVFSLAGIVEAVAMPAKEIAASLVKLHNASAAGDAVHYARAQEIGPATAEPARHADDGHRLLHVLPFAAADIGSMQTIYVKRTAGFRRITARGVRGGAVAGRTGAGAEEPNLSTPCGAAGLYPQAARGAATVRDTRHPKSGARGRHSS